ncbi:MAG: L-aspartate oxidase [Phycisphaeraceae bacterium]|nr:MAG: L-aspartate oxidase [Phycisphaeraceae bacterium]
MDGIFEQRRYLIPFRSILLPQIFTDTLVIGAGSAGLRAALAASKHGDVIVLAKADAPQSNSAWAQGGIAAVVDAADSTDAHFRDTMSAGAGLCDEGAVRSIIEAGSGIVEYLLSLGFRADQNGSGSISLGREGGHSHRRILHADGDATGRELMRVLLDGVEREPNIRMFDRCFALDLLTPQGSNGPTGGTAQCLGAITHHPQYGLQVIWAKATILASGGAGVVWRETTNPPVATGDGLAMAFRAGAALADLAFMQFHPTTLYVAGASRTLISEAVRGEGAYLLDGNGNRFMQQVHELGELAPRDIVSHGIADVISSQGLAHVWLDARHIPNFSARFPGIAQTLAKFDLDASQDLIPVNPAAHYMVGGVQTDLHGRTTVPGLYAVGEVGSTGLHGANRLASNSLLEALVVGERAGEAASEMLSGENTNPWGVIGRSGPLRVISDIPISDHGELDLSDVRSSLRSAMWRNVGLVRTGSRLRDVAEMFDFWARYTLDKIFDAPSGWEVQNMLLVGSLIARAAAWREESRGCHQRQDFGQPSERFNAHDVWTRGQSGVTIREVDLKATACEA